LHRSHSGFPLVVFVLVAGSANASLIYNNLGTGDRGGLFIGNLTNTEVTWANEFLTPSNSRYSLDNVMATISGAGASDSISAFLYSNNSGVPGSSLGPINTLTPGSAKSTVTFTPSGNISLQANTQYWIVLIDNAGNNTFGTWYSSATETGTGVTNENHAEWTGAAWISRPNNSFTAEIPEMEINATAVPEPGTFVLIGCALVALATGLRRRNR